MEQFLWGDRLSTADSEISPRMHRESAKGSGAFLFIRAFFPLLHFMKNKFPYTHANEDTDSKSLLKTGFLSFACVV